MKKIFSLSFESMLSFTMQNNPKIIPILKVLYLEGKYEYQIMYNYNMLKPAVNKIEKGNQECYCKRSN